MQKIDTIFEYYSNNKKKYIDKERLASLFYDLRALGNFDLIPSDKKEIDHVVEEAISVFSKNAKDKLSLSEFENLILFFVQEEGLLL